MPYAIFDYMGAFLRSSFAHVDNVIPVIKTITWLLLSRLQGNKPHRNSPEPSEPSGTFLRNLHQHAPELSRTLRNLPRPSGTNLLEPFGTYLLNLRQHTPEPSEIFWNLPPEPIPFYTGTSGTCLRNLHQHTLELSGTFRNLPLEPAPATRTGTHRSLSGLKTPLAYAVGEKTGFRLWKNTNRFAFTALRCSVARSLAKTTSVWPVWVAFVIDETAEWLRCSNSNISSKLSAKKRHVSKVKCIAGQAIHCNSFKRTTLVMSVEGFLKAKLPFMIVSQKTRPSGYAQPNMSQSFKPAINTQKFSGVFSYTATPVLLNAASTIFGNINSDPSNIAGGPFTSEIVAGKI